MNDLKLTLQREREYWNRIQNGDDVAISELVQENLEELWPIARALANKEGKWSADDLFQEGALAMVRFAQRWQWKEGIPFRGASRQRVRGAMRDFLRRKADVIRGQCETLSLDYSGEDSTETYQDRLHDEIDQSYEGLKPSIPVIELPSHLNARERLVLELRVLSNEPLSLEETAKKMSIKRRSVILLQRRAMRSLMIEAA